MSTIIFGLICLSLGLWGVSAWWWSLVEVLRGLVPLLAVILGFVALGAGVTKMHESAPEESMDPEMMDDSSPTDE
ncbi:Magnetosome protein MamI [Gammaproteobacteria bacterium]